MDIEEKLFVGVVIGLVVGAMCCGTSCNSTDQRNKTERCKAVAAITGLTPEGHANLVAKVCP